MKIYEYAKQRNILSKDVVKKLHELGYDHVKNHLSLVPEKIIEQLDEIPFLTKEKAKPKVVHHIGVVSMECQPFFSRGLGDLVFNRVSQQQLAGHNVYVVLPLYQLNKDELQLVKSTEVTVYNKKRQGTVYYYQHQGVHYYFIESDDYFNREKLYGYYDDAERFAFLSRVSLDVYRELGVTLDTINVHDWPFGLYPLLFKDVLKESMPETKIEFSAYGATYQGIYGVEVLTDVFALDRTYFDEQVVEYASSVNFLKSGLVTADRVDVNKVALDHLKQSYLKDFVFDNM